MKTVSRKAICFLCVLLVFALCALPLAAQSEDDFFFDDDVFTSSDDVFGESSFSDISFGDDDVIFEAWGADGDDALFVDEGIEVLDESASSASGSDGVIFEAGSVKIGGRLSSSVSSDFLLYDEDDDTSFVDRLYETSISPAISADISLDARPSDTLRMYTKFSLGYPFKSSGTSSGGSVSITDFIQVKEMFTDFSLADRAFFRFGLHTVSWGTGYFFSPCSDMINSGKIDPENADEQVDGSLNLRTQIIFPGSQNCLWLYAIPETGSGAKARDTALAAKMEFVTGGFELGGGAFYQYDKAPKAMMTASGSIINGKVSVFGEGVFQYGADSEWADDTSFEDKTALFKATAGFSYMWKDPEIMLMGQYLYDSNNKDAAFSMDLPSPMSGQFVIPNQTYGHNIALMTSFSKLPLLKNCSLSILGLMNIGKDELDSVSEMVLENTGSALGLSSKDLASVRATATLNYAPSSNLSFSAGVSSKWVDFDSDPVLEATLSATLGGGKF